METIIGVRFKPAGKIYYFKPGDLQINIGDGVIVETIRGIEYGTAVLAPKEIEKSKTPLKSVMRIATEKDKEQVEKNKIKAKEAYPKVNELIEKNNLDMKIIDIEYTFDAGKIIIYFAADGRVDFRELVKDLASALRTRIELRQIGVRDEAKTIGGIGPCGRMVCCNSFLGDFSPVSIKMAKEQGLSLSPTKISGLCGRLMCCLGYEEEYYEKTRRKLPPVGITVTSPDGEGEVMGQNILSMMVKVKIMDENETFEIREYPADALKWDRKRYKHKEEEIEITPDMKEVMKEDTIERD